MLFQRKKKEFLVTSDVLANACLMPFRLKSGQTYPCGHCWVCRQNLEKDSGISVEEIRQLFVEE